MICRYWFKNSPAEVIEKVDRVVFTVHDELRVRYSVDDCFKWKTIHQGSEYDKFLVSEN